MTRTKLILGLCLLVLSTPRALAQHPGLEVQVFIPEGMPIKLQVERDLSEPGIAKYIVKRIVSDDAQSARIATAMLDKDGKLLPQSVFRGTSNRLADPMSVATGDTRAVKLLIIVEVLNTAKGKWVPDNEEHQLSIKELIEHGSDALPKAKFLEVHRTEQ
jgi:hypothetical protein